MPKPNLLRSEAADFLTENSLSEPYLVTSERTAPDLITIWGRPTHR